MTDTQLSKADKDRLHFLRDFVLENSPKHNSLEEIFKAADPDYGLSDSERAQRCDAYGERVRLKKLLHIWRLQGSFIAEA
jgi:hypothetical protein